MVRSVMVRSRRSKRESDSDVKALSDCLRSVRVAVAQSEFAAEGRMHHRHSVGSGLKDASDLPKFGATDHLAVLT